MSVNNVLLVGHLGADPELRATASGKSMCRLSVATNRPRRDGAEADPDWHRVVTWERTAENCHRFLRKGRMVAVEGRIQSRRWEDGDGRARWTTEIVAHRVTFLGGRGAGDGGREARAPAPEPVPDALPF
ncbi:MAG: single-stranded DNA-binding protein [Myxococcota bacterium]